MQHARSFGSPTRATWHQRHYTLGYGRAVSLTVQASSKTVPVTVSMNRKVGFGELFKLVGNQPFLGDWDVSKAAPLQWNDGHIWSTTLTVPVGVDVSFKVIHIKDNNATWESGSDRTFKALGPDFSLNIALQWNDTNSMKITTKPLSQQQPDGGQQQSVPAPASSAQPKRGVTPISDDDSSAGQATYSRSSMEEEARATGAWVGAEPEFVRSRKDKGARQGVWRTDGLPELEADIVRGDEKSSNWLGKLGLMKQVLVDKPQRMRPGVEELAACYVYATWINTGAIPCVETGGHHRPNHHANAALQMFRSLEWAISDAGVGEGGAHWPAEARVLAARRMHTRLPSISGDFRVSTPLTRIRDIAHRNDIPKPLKDEIKHTLQNKLHRSAGPEDLVATEAMLARITATPGEYSTPFVEEFKLFTKELREFFNATGLVDLLDQTAVSMGDDHKAVANQFKAAMSRLDASSGSDPSMDDLMAALFMGTQTRGYFARGLSAGLRNDIQDDVLVMRQRWRLAEIRIEEYVFVLLARIIGQLEKAGGVSMLAKPGSAAAWRVAVGALINGLRQLGLSGYATRELLALDNELEAWLSAYTNGSVASQREAALRGKACFERVLRLASQYSDLVMSVYVEPSKRLGHALGVPLHMASIFGESEVRASVAFQVSRLAGLVTQALRQAAGMDAWDPLVTGDAMGRLVEVESLTQESVDAAGRGHQDDMVLLVRRADGDEEIGSMGGRLAGVVLCQELPHLSHLGVRARQEQVVFAMCDDENYVNSKLRPLIGKHVLLSVKPGTVTLQAGQSRASQQTSHSAERANGKQNPTALTADHVAGNGSMHTEASNGSAGIRKVSRVELVPLSQAAVNTCGSKAARCGDLERLTQSAGQGLFTTPPGVTLPFGCMEAALKDSGIAQEFQACLKQLEQANLAGADLDAACARMAAVLARVKLPDNIINQISGAFNDDSLLAVRSSANVEDLAGMSAAGLYESRVGVPAGDAEAIRVAVADVWASLYTRRAVLSRRAAGVSQSDACMAVLIMELIAPEVSYVLHTARPSDSNTNIVLAELAPGQGETLASGTRGTPWRLEVDKTNQQVNTLAFANFSHALVLPSQAGPAAKRGKTPGLRYSSFDELHGHGGGTAVASPPQPAAAAASTGLGTRGMLVEVEVDYSKQRLSVDADYRSQVGQLLARVGKVIEGAYGGEPQDIEGGLLQGPSSGQPKVVVFQTRPQH